MLQHEAATPSMLSQMDMELGRVFASAVHVFTQRHGLAADDIDLVGSGGHLVSLTARPPKGQYRSNVCLGEGAIISAKTGITTVSDFRTTEQAVGRQGKPLLSSLFGLLLHHSTRLRIYISIGRISTVCFVPSDVNGEIDAIYDWDTGPGTVLIDAGVRFYSLDPLHTSAVLQGGTACRSIIGQILKSNGYLRLRPPKATAREIFNDGMSHEIIAACQRHGCSGADTIAILIGLTTASITQQLLLFGPGITAINNADIVVESDSTHSQMFLSDLHSSFPGANFSCFEAKTGVPNKAKKPVGFAMQAMETFLERALPVVANADVRRPNTNYRKNCARYKMAQFDREVGGIAGGTGVDCSKEWK